MAIPTRKPLQLAGRGDGEQGDAVDDGCRDDEDLPTAGPVREPAAEQRSRHQNHGWHQGAEEDLLLYLL